MKKNICIPVLLALLSFMTGCANAQGSQNKGNEENHSSDSAAIAKVYMFTEISSDNLVKIYEALGRKATGKVAVKISTGEPGGHNFLDPNLIKNLVQKVNGKIVECNTAYGGGRTNAADHMRAAEEHGFTAIAPVDIMDAIHSAGTSTTSWGNPSQDDFLESMAEAAKAVADHCGDNILYISVANNLSVDCDCDSSPEDPQMGDIGILASLDPVALDKACTDLVRSSEDHGKIHLIERIDSRNGMHTLDHAEALGLGSQKYELIHLD